MHMNDWYDTVMAAHGRTLVTAIGLKQGGNPVLAYYGDGAAYAISMAETMRADVEMKTLSPSS